VRWPCWGEPEYTFSDVERAIQQVTRALAAATDPAGIVATAQAIQASDNPQTQVEVNAADTSKQ